MSGEPDRSEFQKLVADPGGYIRGVVLTMLVGSILTLLTAIVGFGLDIVTTVRTSLGDSGAEIVDQLGSLGDTVVEYLIVTPIEAIGGIASAAGIFAPLVSALLFALVTAMTAALLYATYRLVVIVT